MNFKTILIGLISSLCLLSCSKDELKDVTLPMSYYDINVDLSNSIKIDSIYDVIYNLNPFTGDTSFIKAYVKLSYRTEIFGNDIFTNKINAYNGFYLNDAPYQLRKEPVTNKYYIQPSWEQVKNKNNSIKFKFILYKDESDPTRSKIASNEYFFNM
jgi:hypothetical protein